MVRTIVVATLFGWTMSLAGPPQGGAITQQPEGRGTYASPVVVEVKEHQKTTTEAAADKRREEMEGFRDRWALDLAVIGTAINGLLFVVGAAGVLAAIRTLGAIQRQVHLMEKELVVSKRAYLALGPIAPPIGGEVTFEIHNEGQLPALIVSIDVEIINLISKDKVGQWDRQAAPFETLNPRSDPFRLVISLPPETNRLEDVLMSVTIEYGIGFGREEAAGLQPKDFFRFVRVYSEKKSAWLTAATYAEIDFSGRAPS
jgi:hypothetical protein